MCELGFDPVDAKTFILVSHGRVYVKSDAAVWVAGYFRCPWKLLGAIKIIPRPVRDYAYNLVARNRFRWFGRLDTCMAPTPEIKARFMLTLGLFWR